MSAMNWLGYAVTTDAADEGVRLRCACGHRVTWHHDERGCGYHGYSTNRCPCDLSSDGVVERIVAARLGEGVVEWGVRFGALIKPLPSEASATNAARHPAHTLVTRTVHTSPWVEVSE